MSHCEFEDIILHLNDRISSIRQVLELWTIAKDHDKRIILGKMGQDVLSIDGLFDQFEKCVGRQKYLLKNLKELEECFLKDVKDGKHLRDNMPTHMSRKAQPAVYGRGPVSQSGPVDVQPAQQEHPRKTSKNQIREMEFITCPEFKTIPQ
ncbi:unnamed protein product [Coregonus sp. 'balchen']|nr:unnamed protein product [Coregonus sp. 'balchen']